MIDLFSREKAKIVIFSQTLKSSLELFTELLQKEFIIAISKSDLLDQELTDAIVKELPKKIPHIFIFSLL